MIVNVISDYMLLCEVKINQIINLKHSMIIKNMFETFKGKMECNLSWADIKI